MNNYNSCLQHEVTTQFPANMDATQNLVHIQVSEWLERICVLVKLWVCLPCRLHHVAMLPVK